MESDASASQGRSSPRPPEPECICGEEDQVDEAPDLKEKQGSEPAPLPSVPRSGLGSGPQTLRQAASRVLANPLAADVGGIVLRDKLLTEREAREAQIAQAKAEQEARKSTKAARLKAAELYRGLKKSDYLVHMAKLIQKQHLIDQGLSGAELSAQLDKSPPGESLQKLTEFQKYNQQRQIEA